MPCDNSLTPTLDACSPGRVAPLPVNNYGKCLIYENG